MGSRLFILISYSVLGFLFILLNKKITNLNYKLILYYTDKLNLKDLFLFKIDHKNKNSMLLITRIFTITFGFTIFLISIYFIYS